MLVLSRKVGEDIVIGNDITIHLCSIEKDKVRLGITAPKEVPVHRLEVWEAIQQEKEASDVKPEVPDA